MKNNVVIALIFVILISVIAVLFYYFGNFEQEKKFVWNPTLKHDENEPYDFSLLQTLLKQNFDFTRIEKEPVLPLRNSKGNAYIFIGHYPYYSEKTSENIIEFAKNGGEVLLVTETLPDSLLYFIDSYKNSEAHPGTEFLISKKIEVSFDNQHNSINYPFFFKRGVKDTSERAWAYFTSYLGDFQPIGHLINPEENKKKYVNFAGMKLGEGHIYWHCNPLLFTNLYLSKNNETGYKHLNAFFAHFDAKKWYWDHHSVYYRKNSERKKPDKPITPMQYIFSQPALKLAWIILLVLALLYALFGAKRRQQHIPIIEANRNTSLEFVNTIGLLYFQQQDHKVIFEKIMQLFRAHLRRRYGLILKDEDLQEEEKIRLTVKRTDISQDIIRKIFAGYLELKSKLTKKDVEMSAETLNKFYQLVDQFYKAETARKLSVKNTQPSA